MCFFRPGCLASPRPQTPAIESAYPLTFPDDFAWGVAVAAQHVEHQQPGDWTAFERHVIREGRTGTGDQPGQASQDIRDLDKCSQEVRQKVDFDSRYASDFQALAELGLNIIAGLSWARLFPRGYDRTRPGRRCFLSGCHRDRR